MMEKVVIDTNVLVSALLSKQEDSATVKVIGMLLEGKLITIATEGILREYGEVLRRRKFGFPEDAVAVLMEEIRRTAVIIEPEATDEELPDEKDRPFYDAMMAESDAVLITGNLRHFPPNERIMSARTFIESRQASQNT